ncbi:hypothetical protein TIFTF001_001885 [Ficus carica]|uniref:Pentatricopeptide repeat-containing protein n=1 Tax=Ficus carica TaxID=3494 RepID=A0AA88CSL7_FICCA|nr:hypothetical protein TIFTF001_001885 [Ficus carica]
MKLQCLSKLFASGSQKNLHNKYNSRVLTSLSFSTKTLNPPSSSSSDSLYERIQIIRDPKSSVLPVLRQWVSEGRPVDKRQLGWLIRTMNDFRRFHHALEISLWMTDSRFLNITPGDAAVRLDLIHKVHGLERAENYFNNMSRILKTYNAYGALLRIYVRERCVEKAEATMQEIRNMGVKESSFAYNVLIDLYTRTGEYDKIDLLIQEMKTKGIRYDKYTLRNRMYAYIAASDILGMEKLLKKMEDNPLSFVDWKFYSLAASGYLKHGLVEQAVEMLQKLEQEVNKRGHRKSKSALMFLVTLYAKVGNTKEIFRVWNAYKPSEGRTDGVYACMINTLTKLDDIEGAERIFEEWNSQCKIYDFRVLNAILVGYCRKGLFDKAESALEKAVEGRTPFASSFNILANGYTANKQMPKAVEMLKKGLSICRKGWTPNPVTLAACLDYLKEQGDVAGMEEIVGLLRNLDVLSMYTYQKLLSVCNAAEESFSAVLRQMNTDGVTADETNKMNMDGFSSDEEEETHEIHEKSPYENLTWPRKEDLFQKSQCLLNKQANTVGGLAESNAKMKLHWPTKLAAFGFLKNHLHRISLLSTSLFSTTTLNPPSYSYSYSSSSSSDASDSLFRRIQVIRDPKASILPVLREWVGEGRPISRTELSWLVRTMRDFRRFHHALQVSPFLFFFLVDDVE